MLLISYSPSAIYKEHDLCHMMGQIALAKHQSTCYGEQEWGMNTGASHGRLTHNPDRIINQMNHGRLNASAAWFGAFDLKRSLNEAASDTIELICHILTDQYSRLCGLVLGGVYEGWRDRPNGAGW